jgi:hypothetical protein
MTPTEYEAFERVHKASAYRFQKPGTAAKAILIELSENIGTYQELFPFGPRQATSGHDGPRQATMAQTPSPARARGSSSGSGEEKKEKRERKKRSRPAPLPSASASASEVTDRVIAKINELRPPNDGEGFEAKTYLSTITTLMRRGHTEKEFLAVVKWRAEESRRSGEWTWFKPATIFRVKSFAEKLDEARAGVRYGQTTKGGQGALFDDKTFDPNSDPQTWGGD